MISTKDIVLEACKALGLVIVFIALIMAPEVWKAYKTKPSVKTGHGTQFQPTINKKGTN